jgi:hypothetical protein
MGVVKDLLFGKEYQFQDPKLGEFKTRIRNANNPKNHTWMGTFFVNGQKSETVIISEGNVVSPFKDQLKAIHSIIDSINQINQKVESEWKISQNSNGNYDENWLSNYYLAAIIPRKIENNSFEINYESINQNSSDMISLTWENSKISEFEILK